MVKLGLLIRIQAKPGKEAEVAEFLTGALALSNQEAGTPIWFAMRLGASTFGIFDAFADELAREAHLHGRIAAGLMSHVSEWLSVPPVIEKMDLLAVKWPS